MAVSASDVGCCNYGVPRLQLHGRMGIIPAGAELDYGERAQTKQWTIWFYTSRQESLRTTSGAACPPVGWWRSHCGNKSGTWPSGKTRLRGGLGGDLIAAIRAGPGRLERHVCAAGLVAALVLCAAVRTHHHPRKDSKAEDRASITDISGNFNVGQAYQRWPNDLPADCDTHSWCQPYLEALVALSALRYCIHCLEHSSWPINPQEINDNTFRWLYEFHASSPSRRLPSSWRGTPPKAKVRLELPLQASGVFAGDSRGAQQDPSGVSFLVFRLASTWSHEALASAAVQGGGSAIGSKLFRRIFGPLYRLWEIGARGPVGVQAIPHVDDFRGHQRGQLRFYVYDLPDECHARVLSALHGRIRESVPEPSTCDFGLSSCTDLSAGGGAFSGYRPYATEATFLAKLLRAPEGVLVDNPSDATYFVVPFLSSTWCFLGSSSCWVRCGGMRPLNALLPLLVHYNASTAHRHLFLASDSVGDLPTDLQMQPLVMNYGPNPCEISNAGGGPLIAPPPVTDELPAFTSDVFASKDLFIVTADGIGSRPFRREATLELERWQRRLPHLFVVARRGSTDTRGPTPADFGLLLRRSLFCPVLPGDNNFRMRLFHAVLAGCIPVVISFPGGSWYRNNGPSVERSLPFSSRIDWHGLAVELHHDPLDESFASWARRLVPSLVRLSAEHVRQRQMKLQDAAPLLRFDFEGARPDAFTALLDELGARALAHEFTSPPVLECFDPQIRFQTQRTISGANIVEKEEREILGAIACCPLNPNKRQAEEPLAKSIVPFSTAPSTGGSRRELCNMRLRGRCVRFHSDVGYSDASEEIARREKHLRAHVKAVFDRVRFEEYLPDEQLCVG